MGLWSLNTPPNWHNPGGKLAIATPAGWQDPDSGELLVAIVGLSTFKEPNGAPGLGHVYFDKLAYKHGDTAYVIAQFSEPVVVTGTPQATISVAGSPHTLSYASGSGTSFLKFSYTVGSSDVATAGQLAISSPLSLNGGTIKGTTNTALTITSPSGTFPVGATMAGASSHATGVVKYYDSGNGILYMTEVSGTFTTETLTVVGSGATAGTPVLNSGAILSIPVTAGGSGYLIPPVVTITDGSGSEATAFAVLTAGVVTAIVMETNGIDYVSPSVSIAVQGHATISAISAPAAPLTFSSDASVALTVMDAVLPTISSITIPVGSYVTGQTMPITVTFSKAIAVLGNPTMTVNMSDSSTTGTAVSDINSTGFFAGADGLSTTLVYNYIVQAADQANQADFTISSPLLLPNGSTIRDEVGNPATLTHSATFPLIGVNDVGGVLSLSLGASPSSQGGTADFQTGDVLTFNVLFDQVVVVTGTPLLPINVDVTGRNASYSAGSGTNTLSFTYTAVSGDAATQSQLTSGTSISLNGGTIKDLVGTSSAITFTQASFTTATVNVAFVTGVTGAPAAGNHITGEIETLTATFNENVTVATAVPYIAVTIGSNTRHFVYTSGSGTQALAFTYTLVSGDAATAGNYTIGSAITANGATLQNAAGKNATLTFTPPVTTGVVVNDPAPTMSTPTIAAGNYLTSQTIPVVVAFNKAVNVVGVPTIAITTTGGTRTVNYSSGSGTSNLTFNYLVVSGDTIGAVSSAATSLTLSGATVQDLLGTTATNSFSAASTFAGVATNDTPATLGTPAVTNPTEVTYPIFNHTGPDIFTLTFTASKAVTVTGAPYVAVTTAGGVRHAAYSSGTGTSTLVFAYSTVAGDVGTAGSVSVAATATLNSGTMKDSLGIPITLTFVAPNVTAVSII